ncbi:hypothetical protein AGMMS50229_07620 [Campylobacterota bacterium]|nr:hypothetical protein AGMMS50229_07620 [Campylobacterota bacterium]
MYQQPIKPYKKYLCAFGDSRLGKSIGRFRTQAKKMNMHNTYIYTEHELDSEFYAHFADKFKLRGFGYWCWKPQVILQTLAQMNDGDILLYADIGCHLNPNGLKRLDEYFDMTNSSPSGLLAFQMDRYLEKIWTKGDLFDYFSLRDNENIYNTGQILSGVIFVKKCASALTLIKSWQQVYYDNWILVTDAPSHTPNFEGFIENRHDQSVFSILAKLNQAPVLSEREIWASNFNDLHDKPILAKRDRLFEVTLAPYIKWSVPKEAFEAGAITLVSYIKWRTQRRYKRTAEKIRRFLRRF